MHLTDEQISTARARL